MMQQTKIDGVTVARGAIGNPWIFEQARALAAGQPIPEPPSLSRQADVMREHFSLCEQTYGANRAPLLMRKFAIKYSQSHPQHKTIRLALAKLKTREEFDAALAEHYVPDGPGQMIPRDYHGSQEEC